MATEDARDYLRRESGILLHPTSLPGPHGIGDVGAEARRFVDFLEAGGQHLWQLLPLGPAGYGDSPYATTSAMAGNPVLISLDTLAREGMLGRHELEKSPVFPVDRVDYPAVHAFKTPLLRQAHRRFQEGGSAARRSEFAAFCQHNASWLEDFALYMAIKEDHEGAAWYQWEPAIATRQPEALARERERLSGDVAYHQFVQFQFSRQWHLLKRYANQRGVRLIGDIPIFVALDSADVWSRPEQFHLDERGQPTVVAGVPPDYFSKTGQRWGNPLYRWDAMARDGNGWWIDRFRATLEQVDIVRIDHFRGFAAYWEVPAQHETAEKGRWVDGPGEAFFRSVEQALGPLPVIAEDLGTITPDVEALRLQLGYPGMKVLQFAFGDDPSNPYLPHNYERRYVVYTGTHDNDTTVGWFRTRPPEEQELVLRYLNSKGHRIHWDLIRLALASVADAAVIPLQDVLGLDTSARMNFPGQPEGNWAWRYAPDQLRSEHAARLRQLSAIYGRYQGS